jgi:hypothetical protein
MIKVHLVSLLFLFAINKTLNIEYAQVFSEPIMCDECGQEFDTIESLREHIEVEAQEKELRNKRINK